MTSWIYQNTHRGYIDSHLGGSNFEYRGGISHNGGRTVIKPMPPPVKMHEADVTPVPTPLTLDEIATIVALAEAAENAPPAKPRIRVKAWREPGGPKPPPSELDDFVSLSRHAGF